MALFKIAKGTSNLLATNRPNTQAGFCYLTTDDMKLYVDLDTQTGSTQSRKPLNALKADALQAFETGSSDTNGRWTVQIPGITELKDGLTIKIRLAKSYNGTYNTLKINNLDAKLVYFSYNNKLTTHIPQWAEILLTYRTVAGSTDQTYDSHNYGRSGWVLDASYNTNDYDRLLDNYERRYAGANAINPYQLCMLDVDGHLQPISIGTSSTEKTANSTPLRYDRIIYYASSGATAANGLIPETILYEDAPITNVTKTFNENIPAYADVYLVGTINQNRCFVLDTSYYKIVVTAANSTIAANTFVRGKYYLYVGATKANNQLQLLPTHQLFYCDDQNGQRLIPANIHSNIDFLPIDSKTYTNVIGTANNNQGAGFFYGKVRANNFNDVWHTKVRVYASAAGQTLAQASTIYDLWGTANTYIAYKCQNAIKNTSYRPAYYNSYFRVSESGYNNDCGGWLGINLIYSWNPTTAANSRTITVELLEQDNCIVELQDNLIKPDNIPLRSSNTAYYSSTNTSFDNFDFCNNGLRETGDDNDTQTLQSYYTRYKAGTNGLKQYSLAMRDGSGMTWQSFTTDPGTGTAKAINPVGFILGEIVYLATGSNYTNNQVVGYGVVRHFNSLIDLRYSFNCGTTLTADMPVFLVGTINTTDGLFYLSSPWWAQELPTTEDGKLYVPLGVAYDKYRIDFYGWRDPLIYKDGSIQRYSPSVPQMELANGTLGIEHGGTNATTAAQARTNLGITPANIGAISGVSANGLAPLTLSASQTGTTVSISGQVAAMTAATASAAGKSGIVPAPAAGAQNKFLRGDGTWQIPTDTNTHYTTHLYVNNQTTTSGNATALLTNGNVWLHLLDDTTVRNSINIKGTDAVTVKTDNTGAIVIDAHNTTYGVKTNGGLELSSFQFGIKASGVTNDMLAGSIANAKLANSKVTIAGTDVSLGGSIAKATLISNLGLGNAMHFLGTTTTAITDGSSTASVSIGGTSVSVVAGDVVLKDNKEFVWTSGGKWEELGDEGSFKVKQSAVSDPAASGTSSSFISTISQDANGKITVTKANVPTITPADIGALTNVTASGLEPLALSASISGTIANITGSVAVMTAATASAAGKAGLVPAPAAGKQGQFLRGDGTWQTPANTHYTTHLYVNNETTKTSDATGLLTNGNVWLHLTDDSTVRKSLNIKGSDAVTVKTDNNGAIVIDAHNTTYGVKTNGGLELSSFQFGIKSGGVTNDMLAGSIANGKLANSKITIAGTDVSLGGSITAAIIATALANDFAAKSHTHGKITNAGTVSDSTTIANGDTLIIADASDTDRIIKSGISFDASTTTAVLTKKGTWITPTIKIALGSDTASAVNTMQAGLTLGVDGTLPVKHGGSGGTTFTADYVLLGNGTSAFKTIAKSTSNLANTIVQRDGSGNFSAGTITAALNGNAATASKLGTSNVGTVEIPIYLNGGTATAASGFNVGGNLIPREYLTATAATINSYDTLTRTFTITANTATSGRTGLTIANNKVYIPYGYYFILSCEIWSSVAATWDYDENTSLENNTGNIGGNDFYNNHSGSSTAIPANTWTKVWYRHSNAKTADTSGNSNTNPDGRGLWEWSSFGIKLDSTTSGKQFKIRNVMGYYGSDTNAYYQPSPLYAITNITRSGTTFTATRLDGSTFTFTQQDNNSVTGVKGNAESSYRVGQVNLTPANIGALALSGGNMTGSIYITKAGETGLEVNNTQATNPNNVAFIVGSSGNGGIYSRKHSKWIVYADANGNIVLNGNAATATKFSSNASITLSGDTTGSSSSVKDWAITTTTSKLTYQAQLTTQEAIDNFLTASKFQVATFKTTDPNNLSMASNDGMIISIPWTSTAYGAQLAFDDSTAGVMKFRGKATNWGDWKTVLHDGNYTNYTVTKTGTGASGTWGISITGNASTASTATYDSAGNQISNTYIKKSIGTAKGDIIYWTASGTPARLAIGTANYYLKATADGPVWAALPADTKVTQGTSTSGDWRKVLLNGGSSTVYPAWNTAVGNDVSDITYRTVGVSVQPSTNTLKANNIHAARAFNNLITGTGTAAKDNGSSDTSTRYQPAKWTFNTGANATNGDMFTIKIPVAGHDYGVWMSVNNGTNYYPIVVSGTSRLTTHYGNGMYITVVFDSAGSAASMFALNGGNSRITVNNGVFRVINYYADGNPGDWNLRQYTLKAQTAITAVHIIGGTDSGYNMIDSGTAFDIRYAVLYAASNISAGSAGNNNYIHHYAINIKNSSGTNITLTTYKNIYIKGTISGNLFTPIPGGSPYVDTITAADDGYAYYYIGRAYSTNAFTFDATGRDIFIYKNGAIQRWSGYAVVAYNAIVASSCSGNSYSASNLGLYNGNETTVGSTTTATNDTVWINYRSASNGTTSDSATQLKTYNFGNRKGSTTGVTIVAEKFQGLAAKATADANGNNIVDTYATKSTVNGLLAAADAMIFKGTLGTGGTITGLPNTHEVGWTYKVITAGTYAGQVCEVGDMIVCVADGTAANNAHWTVIQTNTDGAVSGPATSTLNAIARFSNTTGKAIKNSGVTIDDSNNLSTPGNITLTSSSGNSPALIFNRDGSLTDWKILVTAGKLSFQSATDNSAYTERAYFKDNSGDFVANSFTGDGANITLQNSNRLVWTDSGKKLYAGYHYADASKVAINYSGAPTENFYVSGTVQFNLGTANTSSNYRRFIVSGANADKMSIAPTGIQVYDTSNNPTTMYLQYYGGNMIVGSSSYHTATREMYGMFDFKSANGFTYSGIATASDNAARPVWFSYNGINGRPVYDNDFTYNPSTNVLKIGLMTVTGGTSSSNSSSITTTSTLTISAASTIYIDSSANTAHIFRKGPNECARFNTSGMLQLNSTVTQNTHRLLVNGNSAFTGKIAFTDNNNTLTEKAYMIYNDTDKSIDFVFN